MLESKPQNRPASQGAAVDQRFSAERRAAAPSRQSRTGLDWFVFFVADVQTGFGPFVAVYLTSQKWTQTDIGLVLTVGGLVSLFGQVPGGAIVDSLKSLRAAAAIAVIAIGASAFALAAFPIFPIVLLSRVVHACASVILGLALAYISLNLVGRREIGARLGRNASFASVGTALAAAGMGACGYLLSSRAVFFLTASLAIPALVALFRIRPEEIAPARQRKASAQATESLSDVKGMASLLRSRPLIIFAGCLVLFQVANAAMLPLAASMLTLRSAESATPLVAAAIVVPQFITALLSPFVGIKAQQWGRRVLLVAGFSALPLRGLIFAVTSDPRILVAVQALDGVSAAVLGVLVPLVIADVTRRSGHFNLAQGMMGMATGVGAAISTTIAGFLADRFGSYTAFITMALVAACGVVLVAVLMPETGLKDDEDPS